MRLQRRAKDAIEQLGNILHGWVGSLDGNAPLLGVGLGMPGVVDTERRTVNAPMLGWNDLELNKLLERRLRVPVLADNDVNTLAVSERLYGRGREVDHFVTVTIGRGVGLGIVAGGDVYHGAGGGAGEFGHTTVADGPACWCGKKGCLEAVVADPALVAEARQTGVPTRRQGIDKLRALADSGDAGACAIYARAGATSDARSPTSSTFSARGLVLVSGEGTQAWPHLASSSNRRCGPRSSRRCAACRSR